MIPKIPEKNRQPGVCYAVTADGVELPVIDMTNPAFAENASQEQLSALAEDFLRFQKSPAIFRRFFSSHSIAMRGLGSASGKFLDGMTTYVAKLGPNMLGKGYAGLIDRKVASAIGSVSFRIRLREMAQLIASELTPLLAVRRDCPIQMINIGGGPAMDCLNALIVIRKEHPEALEHRPIFIQVLDLDKAGPSFGARALAALLAQGGPLQGLKITLDATLYDWTQPSRLGRIIDPLNIDDILIGSSEGGLFEYGSNETIVENLNVLREHTPANFVMVGSIMREGEITRSLHSSSNMALRMFKPEDFTALVGSCGWHIGRAIDGNPIYQIVCLKKDQAASN